MIKHFLQIIFTFCLFTSSFSQITSIQSNHFWGGIGLDSYQNSNKLSNDLIVSSSVSGSPISGNKDSMPYSPLSDSWIICYDQSYSKYWEQLLGGDQNENNTSLTSINNSLYIGMTSSSGPSGKRTTNKKGLYDALIYNLGPNGDILWEKSFGTAVNGTNFNSITSGENNSIYLACYSSSDMSLDKTENSYGKDDFWIIKLDSDGNKIWDKTVGGDSTDRPGKVVYHNNFIYVIGQSLSSTSGLKSDDLTGEQDAWLVKMDTDGNVIWDKTLGGTGYEVGSNLLVTDNYIYTNIMTDSDVSGNKTDPSNGSYDNWLVKMDLDGNIIYDKSIGGSGNDPGGTVAMIDGDIILMGFSSSPISGDKTEEDINNDGVGDGWVVCIDRNNGNVKWDKTLGSNGGDYLRDIIPLQDGSYMLIGESTSTGGGTVNASTNGQEDVWCTKVDATVSLQEFLEFKESFTIFPNPTKNHTTISFESVSNEMVNITIVNVDGKVVYTNKKAVNNGINQFEVNTSEFAKGMYTVKIEQGQSMAVRKLVVE